MLSKKIILTGASGFIGKHLLTKLLEDNYHVLALKRPESNKVVCAENLIWANINDVENHSFINGGVDAIIHLATDYGRSDEGGVISQYMCNVLLPLRLVELARLKKIPLFISADSFFGKYEYSYMKTYILSKKHFKELAEELLRDSATGFANLRLEHVYGEGDGSKKFIPFIVHALKTSKEQIKCTSGVQRRDFVYVEDVINAFIYVLKYHPSNRLVEYEVGTGESHSLKEMIEELKEQLKSDAPVKYGAIQLRNDEILDSKANIDNLNKLGWHPVYSLKDGVKKMLNKEKIS
ncbi:NAD(P)-dependent oxidoreductase [Mangrovibacter phragmitis]|uniref:NAD-dependent epimerase/dehydratase family protein n=1 Tax=Mangrovibacter phragmitis TaxID=1691903 RepID=UPI00336A57B1